MNGSLLSELYTLYVFLFKVFVAQKLPTVYLSINIYECELISYKLCELYSLWIYIKCLCCSEATNCLALPSLVLPLDTNGYFIFYMPVV